MKITVLTPSIGTIELGKAVDSVARQTRNVGVEHIVVADGRKHESNVSRIAMGGWQGIGSTPRIYSIPHNTGANGWNGHKIYAHFSQLLDTDYLFLLDEDNWFEPNHIETLLPIAQEYGYAWSLRNVYTKSGEYIGVDRKESIGKSLMPNADYALVDTSCWCLRRDQIPYLSYFLTPWSGDRTFTQIMISKYIDITQASSGLATMNYRSPDHLTQFFTNICTP